MTLFRIYSLSQFLIFLLLSGYDWYINNFQKVKEETILFPNYILDETLDIDTPNGDNGINDKDDDDQKYINDNNGNKYPNHLNDQNNDDNDNN